jgi:hypothetical protein
MCRAGFESVDARAATQDRDAAIVVGLSTPVLQAREGSKPSTQRPAAPCVTQTLMAAATR